MSINKTNWNDFIKQVIPWFYRTQTHIDWWKSLIRPLITLYNKWYDFYQNSLYRLYHTTQVIYLEKYLNDQHDPDQRRIYINDQTGIVDYLFNNSEVSQEIYLYNDSENTQEYYMLNAVDVAFTDFTVMIPSNIDQNVIYSFENYTLSEINEFIAADVNRFKYIGIDFETNNF